MSVVDERLENIGVDIAAAGSDEEVELLMAQRDQYEFELESLQVSVDLAESSGASLIDAAPVQSTPFSPRPRRSAFLALVAGALIGVAAAFIVEHFDTTVRDEEELAKATGVPVLAVIPKFERNTDAACDRHPGRPPVPAGRGVPCAAHVDPVHLGRPRVVDHPVHEREAR